MGGWELQRVWCKRYYQKPYMLQQMVRLARIVIPGLPPICFANGGHVTRFLDFSGCDVISLFYRVLRGFFSVTLLFSWDWSKR